MNRQAVSSEAEIMPIIVPVVNIGSTSRSGIPPAAALFDESTLGFNWIVVLPFSSVVVVKFGWILGVEGVIVVLVLEPPAVLVDDDEFPLLPDVVFTVELELVVLEPSVFPSVVELLFGLDEVLFLVPSPLVYEFEPVIVLLVRFEDVVELAVELLLVLF